MYHIAIVDDEPKIAEGIAHLFPWNHFGFEVSGCFTNGKDALKYINSHPEIDVVMTDIQMPVMNGIELSQRLLNSNIIVIFFSAYQDFEYARCAILNHVADYLLKPMKYDEMVACLERIRALLREKDLQKESSAASSSDLQHQDLVQKVKTYIRENYRSASLEEAAFYTHFSTTYLSTTFKNLSGISFSGYLLKVRMEKALELLSDESKKLYEIADSVGYVNPKNLTRNFKDYYKITPQEYRAGKQPVFPFSEEEQT